jgi:DNA primase
MFPIKDAAGRTVAFTGRALDPDDQAKYLNSPETDLFKKSRILFAMDRAKDAIRTRGFALLMEGQMDVIHAHQAGFTNTVGISGTALTAEHLSLLKRYSENLMLALDGDRAGLAATQKHAIAALRAGMRVKAVRLPKGKDPADVITEDAKDFAKRVADAESVIEFFLAVLSEAEKDQHRLVLAVERIVLPLLAAVQSAMEREHFVGVVARAMGSTPEAVRASLKSVPRDGGEPAPGRQPAAPQEEPITDLVRLAAIVESYPDSLLANRVKNEYNRITGAAMPTEESPERVSFETGILYGEAPGEHAADDVLKRFEKSALTKAYDDALTELRRAERGGDPESIRAAEAACAKLVIAIAAL